MTTKPVAKMEWLHSMLQELQESGTEGLDWDAIFGCVEELRELLIDPNDPDYRRETKTYRVDVVDNRVLRYIVDATSEDEARELVENDEAFNIELIESSWCVKDVALAPQEE